MKTGSFLLENEIGSANVDMLYPVNRIVEAFSSNFCLITTLILISIRFKRVKSKFWESLAKLGNETEI